VTFCGSVYRDSKARGCRLDLGHPGRCDARWRFRGALLPVRGVRPAPELDDPSEALEEAQARRDDELRREEAT